MTSEANNENEPTSESIGRSRMQAIILGSCVVITLVSLVYAYVTRTSLEKTNQELMEMIQKKDSVIQQNEHELTLAVAAAAAARKKAEERESAKAMKPKAKETPKKSKPKKK